MLWLCSTLKNDWFPIYFARPQVGFLLPCLLLLAPSFSLPALGAESGGAGSTLQHCKDLTEHNHCIILSRSLSFFLLS
uniref:Uncharacterized protein n=1 Tax=Arundo donax TaxID=35708 RepID=A0A0A9DQN2_ARUDO